MLGTVALALYHGISRIVGNPHRRFGSVNVLAAGAAGAIDVNAQIRRINIDFNIIMKAAPSLQLVLSSHVQRF